MGEARPFRNDKVDVSLLRTVGEHVRTQRKRQGWSRRVLSEQSGVSPRYLAQLENGEGNISISLLARVAIALGCDLSALIKDERSACNALLVDEAKDIQLRRVWQLLQQADSHTLEQVLGLLECDPEARQQRICLMGLRGAGKSTLGFLAGQRLNIPFVELNQQIEQLTGMPVAEIIALYGADGYRRFEAEALDKVIADYPRVILAAAGGVVSNQQTYQHLLYAFHTIWLRATPADHMQRVLAQGDTRPMAGNPAAMEQLKKLLADRALHYARAMTQVDTGGRSVEQSLNLLLDAIEQFGLDFDASAEPNAGS